MHVVLAGGGTAGHIEPALALADALRRQDPTVGITALGTERGLETRLVPERGYELALIPAVPLPRKPTPELITVPGRLRGTIKAAEQILERTKADAVVGFGGYVALPGYLAAKRLGVPIVVHEANARPGLANKIGSRYAAQVAVSTPDSKLRDARYIGIPLRRSIATLDRAAVRPEARAAFGLDPNLPTLLVSGGSQGARRLNEVVQRVAPFLQQAGIQVLHAVGPKNELPQVHQMPGMPPYIPVPYVDRMDLAYAAADMMLCRAGAMTVAELSAVGLPAAYVPLPIGNGEQRLNAQPVVKAGGGLLVDDAELTPEWVQRHVLPVLADPHRLYEMSRAASEFGRRDADELLVGMVYEAIASRHAARTSEGRAGSVAGGATTAERGERQQDSLRPAPSAASCGRLGPRRLRTIVILVLAAARSSAAGAVWVLYGSRWLRVERVTVSGTDVLTRDRCAKPPTCRSERRWSPSTPTRSRPDCAGNCPGSTRLRSVRSWPHGIGLKVIERTRS